MKKSFNIKITPEGRTFSYLYDKTSGIMRSEPIPSPEELKIVYGGEFDYSWYKKRYVLKKEQAKNRWKSVKASVKGSTLLDIGCGHGLFLDFAAASGLKTFGADFPSQASAQAREKGHTVFEGDFLSYDFKGAKFDTVTMWHSLEHFIDPASVLKKLHTLINNDGVLIIAVPNLAAKGFDLRGESWVWIQQPFFHIWHWTPPALTKLAADNGFEKTALITRDTWDANILYDGYIAWWFENGMYFLARKADRLFGLIFKGFNFFREQAAFLICESARILFFTVSLALAAVIKDDLKRSELLLTCKKKDK